MDNAEPLPSGYLPDRPGRVKLNQNESPFGLDAADRDALAAVLGAVPLHRYPDPLAHGLRERLAAMTGVSSAMVVVDNGANALLDLLVRATCAPGDEILTCGPTYHLYGRLASLHHARLVVVPWAPGWGFPAAALGAAVGPRTRLILLCRPNNPTGHLFAAEDVLALARGFHGLVVVDEAYFDFCQDTVAGFLDALPNLVVVRTLSKAYGAAGARLGYLLAPALVARALGAMQIPYGVGALSQTVGGFLLERPGLLERQRARIIAARQQLASGLRRLGHLTVFPSAGNFLLVRTTGSADALDRYLRANDIFVRNLRWQDRHLRISVGTPDDQAHLLAALGRWEPPVAAPRP